MNGGGIFRLVGIAIKSFFSKDLFAETNQQDQEIFFLYENNADGKSLEWEKAFCVNFGYKRRVKLLLKAYSTNN